jgi:hypothetical protein
MLKHAYYCFFSALLFFVGVPLSMFGATPAEYYFVDLSVFFRAALTLSIAMGSALSLLCILLGFLRLDFGAQLFSRFVFHWIFVSGFFLPVSVRSEMVDPIDVVVNTFNLALTMMLAGLLTWISLGREQGFAHKVICFMILGFTVAASIAIYGSDLAANEHDSLLLSNKRNILVVSFDGLPGDAVESVIRDSETLSHAFKDFEYFSNAVSQSPATFASMLGELFGVHDFKSKGASFADVYRTLQREGLTEKLLLNQISDSYGLQYLNIGKRMQIPSSKAIYQGQIGTLDFFRYPIVRMLTRYPLALLDWDKHIGGLRRLVIEPPRNAGFISRIASGNGPRWDAKYIATQADFDEFIQKVSTDDNKEFSLRYMHFLFTHFPVDFDQACNYRGNDDEWYAASQNYKGVLAESHCPLKMVADLMKRLRELRIYDNTLIVVKSDHGKPVIYNRDYPNHLKINGHLSMGYDRYRPVLMVKDFGVDEPNLRYRNEVVLLNDLAITLCLKTPRAVCDSFPGINIMSDTLAADIAVQDAPYFVYVVRNAKSSHRFRDHISVKIPSRRKTLLKAMRESDSVELSGPWGNVDSRAE